MINLIVTLVLFAFAGCPNYEARRHDAHPHQKPDAGQEVAP